MLGNKRGARRGGGGKQGRLVRERSPIISQGDGDPPALTSHLGQGEKRGCAPNSLVLVPSLPPGLLTGAPLVPERPRARLGPRRSAGHRPPLSSASAAQNPVVP